MNQRRGILGSLGAVVGGTPVRRGMVVFSLALGSGAAVTGSCGSCTPDVPPVVPTPQPIPTMPSMTTGAPIPIPTVPEPPQPPPEKPCVFVRPSSASRDVGVMPESRIVGGTPALPGEAPWMASLQTASRPTGPSAHFCGGSVYAGRFVLTASHCVVGMGRTRVVVGRRDLRTSEGWEFVVEPGDVMMPAREGANGLVVGLYDPGTLDWDAALIDLQGPAGVDSLELHEGSLRPVDGIEKPAQAYGWGRVYAGGPIAPALQKIQDVPPIIPQPACRSFYDNLTSRMICADAKGSGSCQGDSGGPLLVDGRRVGIVSFGVGCADGWPGVYAFVGAADDALGYSDDLARWVEACTAE